MQYADTATCELVRFCHCILQGKRLLHIPCQTKYGDFPGDPAFPKGRLERERSVIEDR